MKKRSTIYLILLILIVAAQGAFAQTDENVENKKPPKPVDSGNSSQGQISDYPNLQKYFLDIEQNRFNLYDKGVYLHGIYHDIKNRDENKILFRLNYDYAMILNTNNISAGINMSGNEPDRAKIFLSVGMAWGATGSDYFIKNPWGDKAKINTSYFIQGEVEKRWGNFAGFGGMGFNVVYPEKYFANNLVQRNNGTMVDLFLGPRYYLPLDKNSKLSNRNYSLYFQAKVGFPFTNGFTYENGNASSAYYALGFGLTTLESSSNLGKRSRLMDIETGAYASINSKTIYSQFTLPINIIGNLSLGLNGQLGYGFDESVNNDFQASYMYGFGADFRLFAHDPSQFINPYFGLMRNFFGYQIDNKKYSGKQSYLRIGNRIRFGSEQPKENDGLSNFFSNLFLDFNISVPIGEEVDWIPYTKTTYESTAVDLKGGGYIRSIDSLVMDIPANFDITVGLVYKFNRPASKLGGTYNAKWEVYNEDDLSDLKYALLNDTAYAIKEPYTGMLPQETNGALLSEKRIYIKKGDCPPPPPPPEIPPDVIPNLDASDIKMLTLTYQAKSNVDRVSSPLFNPDPQPQDSVVLLLAMFDKERTNTKGIQNANMQLIFTDFNTGNLFGYGYDANGRLQPASPEKFKEYVKELRWLDTDKIELESHSISGEQIETDVFRSFENKENEQRSYAVNRDNYRFAYAIYPKTAFDEIQASTNQNFGVLINFKYDYNNDFNNDDLLLGHFKKDGDNFVIDENDVSFFSNTIVGSRLLPVTGGQASVKSELHDYYNCNQEVPIGHFSLGSDRLTQDQQKDILDAAKLSLQCNISLILGYTDKVEFLRNAEFMNDFLALENAQINAISPRMKAEWESIASEWEAMLAKDSKAIPSDDLCQRGLSWKRIRTVMNELNKYNLVDIHDIAIKAEGIFKADEAGSNLFNNSANRKVVIKFTNK